MRNRLEMGAGMMGKDDLDDLFAQARAKDPMPSDQLIARVLADAAAEQARRAAPVVRRPARKGLVAAIAALFGGGPVLAGMGSAAIAGLFLGFVQPAPVLALTTMMEGGTSLTTSPALDVSTGIDALISEE